MKNIYTLTLVLALGSIGIPARAVQQELTIDTERKKEAVESISTLSKEDVELFLAWYEKNVHNNPQLEIDVQAALTQLEHEIADMSDEEKEVYLSKIIRGEIEQTDITPELTKPVPANITEQPTAPTWKQCLSTITSNSIDAVLIAGMVAAGAWVGYTELSLLTKALDNVDTICLKVDRNIGLRAIGTLLGLYMTKRSCTHRVHGSLGIGAIGLGLIGASVYAPAYKLCDHFLQYVKELFAPSNVIVII
jgi:hypothetical protein